VPRPPSDVERAIARHVVSLLPEEATVQVGPGGVAEAVIAAIDRPVHVWSGLVTDAVAALDARGLLLDAAVCAYTWGSEALCRDGLVSLLGVEETHDISRLSSIDRFAACNTALQVSLDGSVNVERVGGRVVAGIGGHADFSAGASRSIDGVSIVALPSTTRSGASTIVPTVDCVSTPRADIEVVVTEHGIADLRGVDDAERAGRIAAIAAPQHRAALTSFRPSEES
jgi:acyl-CoA hydrolase